MPSHSASQCDLSRVVGRAHAVIETLSFQKTDACRASVSENCACGTDRADQGETTMSPIEQKTDIRCIAATWLIAASAILLLAACGGGAGMSSPTPSQTSSAGPTMMRTSTSAGTEADSRQ